MKQIIGTVLLVFVLVITGVPQESKAIEWAGGNGCNLFDTKNLSPCCLIHDKAYAEGGKEKDRTKADTALFKCIWKRNKFAAPFMFLGVKIGGVFSFQRGKKKELIDVRTRDNTQR
jgi:hypothetical protein